MKTTPTRTKMISASKQIERFNTELLRIPDRGLLDRYFKARETFAKGVLSFIRDKQEYESLSNNHPRKYESWAIDQILSFQALRNAVNEQGRVQFCHKMTDCYREILYPNAYKNSVNLDSLLIDHLIIESKGDPNVFLTFLNDKESLSILSPRFNTELAAQAWRTLSVSDEMWSTDWHYDPKIEDDHVQTDSLINSLRNFEQRIINFDDSITDEDFVRYCLVHIQIADQEIQSIQSSAVGVFLLGIDTKDLKKYAYSPHPDRAKFAYTLSQKWGRWNREISKTIHYDTGLAKYAIDFAIAHQLRIDFTVAPQNEISMCIRGKQLEQGFMKLSEKLIK